MFSVSPGVPVYTWPLYQIHTSGPGRFIRLSNRHDMIGPTNKELDAFESNLGPLINGPSTQGLTRSRTN